MIDLSALPQEVQDYIELKEQTDQTFHRFCDFDYTDIWWNKMAERANPEVEHSLIVSVFGSQGCHLEGTKILTKRGLINIENIIAGDVVWTGKNWQKCIPIIKGKQSTLKITLNNNQVFYMTPDHNMLTQRGFVRADELIQGEDRFVFGNCGWNDEWNEISEKAAIVGMLLADGHLDIQVKKEKYDYIRVSNRKMKRTPKKYHEYECKRVRFYNSKPELLSFFKKNIRKHFGATASGHYVDRGTKQTKVVCISNSDVFDNVVSSGVPIGKKSGIVEIPDWIIKDDAAMNGFISGYLACDGHASEKYIEISSCSDVLINQLMVWLQGKGVACRIDSKQRKGNTNKLYRVSISSPESYNKLVHTLKWMNKLHKVKIKNETEENNYLKYSDDEIMKWREDKNSGMSYQKIADKYGINYSVLYFAMKKSKNGTRNMRSRRKNSFPSHKLIIKKIEQGIKGNVYDLHVPGDHAYVANGCVSHNSGKSLSAIAMCCFMDPKFSIENIYFSYNDLVYNRHKLKPNTAILMDEQSQSYGMDSHRVMIILNNIKEQLRKKSIHLFFCAPVLYEESKTSMYTLETVFIDYENEEGYAALRTREGHTLGHVRIPHPLKAVDASGQSLATKELIDAYQAKKDMHLEKILGNQDQDVFEERAQMVIEHPLFKQAEKLYVASKGYVPQTTLVQIINKIFPEYNSGVVPGEIAGRIKLNKELAGDWIVPGSASPKKKKSKKKK